MVEFGRYEICYIPPGNQVEATIKHTISSEATLEEMFVFFDNFLKAVGYVFEGDLALNETQSEEEYFDSKQYWCDKFFKLLHSDDSEEKE